jgi:hypothetical protein
MNVMSPNLLGLVLMNSFTLRFWVPLTMMSLNLSLFVVYFVPISDSASQSTSTFLVIPPTEK